MVSVRVYLWVVTAIACIAFALGAHLGQRVGYVAGRQSVEAVACEPTVKGIRKNGTEIPLTSAQRDSLAMRP